MGENRILIDSPPVSVETIMLFDLEQLISQFEKDVFTYIVNRKFDRCEQFLNDFCLKLMDLAETEQLFIARVSFIGIITDIIRIQSHKELLHPRIHSKAYETIAIIETWENLSEYLLHIPKFMKRIKNDIVVDHLLFNGNIHVEKALQLIHHSLTNKHLSVDWIATQLEISTTHLSTMFKAHMGENISTYIANRKMYEIIYELTNTNKSLKSIRENYGFYNHSHFIQFFKRMKGITPLQYLQKHVYS